MVEISSSTMNNRALYIVRQNYTSECFKCKKEKIFFTVYRCGRCDPQTVEKYCYECCEASLTSEDEEDDDQHINALCEGCAFCYDYIHVSNFYMAQKKGGWQGLKFDCDKCICCCGGPYCITGSLCCCVPEGKDESESEEEEEEREKKKKKQEAIKKLFEKENNMYYNLKKKEAKKNKNKRQKEEEEEEEEKKK